MQKMYSENMYFRQLKYLKFLEDTVKCFIIKVENINKEIYQSEMVLLYQRNKTEISVAEKLT